MTWSDPVDDTMHIREDGEEFWIVWCPEGTKSPSHCHRNEGAAAREAERLARLAPGKKFFVLHATEYRIVNDMRAVVLAKRDISF